MSSTPIGILHYATITQLSPKLIQGEREMKQKDIPLQKKNHHWLLLAVLKKLRKTGRLQGPAPLCSLRVTEDKANVSILKIGKLYPKVISVFSLYSIGENCTICSFLNQLLAEEVELQWLIQITDSQHCPL